MNFKLKVCGMRNPDNIQALAALKPDYMGFIFYDKSKRYAGSLSALFVNGLPAEIKRTGVFVDEEINEVLLSVQEYGLNALQLHGAETADYCRDLKALLPGVEIIKAFGISEGFNFGSLAAYVSFVDYFLFDTQTPDHGGSGKTFNWKLLDEYNLDIPYFLSGGIGPESLDELTSINDTRLYAIDVNSRFELEPGLKDIELLKDFKNKLPL
ncbi:MAG: phosphoribosylanthranilate isomerase [Bacteroidota bacterium]